MTPPVVTLGIVGSGLIGAAVARLAVAADISVVLANSRGPASLAGLVAELGPSAAAGTVEEAARAGDVVLLSVPLGVHSAVPPEPLRGKTVIDTSNYYPSRDGRIAELDEERLTTSELVQRHLAGAKLVKAFNNIVFSGIPLLARPSGAPDRSALAIAGDHADAKREAAGLIDRLGFDTVDAGSLAESWRYEPESSAYAWLYVADPAATTQDNIARSPVAPVPAAALRAALAGATRVRVGDRTF